MRAEDDVPLSEYERTVLRHLEADLTEGVFAREPQRSGRGVAPRFPRANARLRRASARFPRAGARLRHARARLRRAEAVRQRIPGARWWRLSAMLVEVALVAVLAWNAAGALLGIGVLLVAVRLIAYLRSLRR